MTIRFSVALLAVSALSCASVSSADTLLYKNINGYTFNGDRELIRFAALQVEDDRVAKLYLDGESLPDESELDRVLDGDGKTLTTGLIDAHGHVLSYGQSLLRVDLVGTTTEASAAERVRAFAADKPDLDWVLGRGWNQVLWDSNEFPTTSSLDAVLSDKPIWLSRVDGHAGWANSLAMEIAGVTRDTEDPDARISSLRSRSHSFASVQVGAVRRRRARALTAGFTRSVLVKRSRSISGAVP